MKRNMCIMINFWWYNLKIIFFFINLNVLNEFLIKKKIINFISYGKLKNWFNVNVFLLYWKGVFFKNSNVLVYVFG